MINSIKSSHFLDGQLQWMLSIVESQTIKYMGDWYLLDSEQFGGEPVGCIADCVELVEGEKQLRDPGVDPAGRYLKCIKHFKYVKFIKYVKCIK